VFRAKESNALGEKRRLVTITGESPGQGRVHPCRRGNSAAMIYARGLRKGEGLTGMAEDEMRGVRKEPPG
jgi:hypothetical protein